MPKYLITTLLLFALLASHSSKAQTTIYVEDFNSYADGTTTGPNWTTQFRNCEASDANFEFNVFGGSFRINDVEGLNCGCPNANGGDNSNTLTITGIDVSGFCDVFVNLDYSADGDLECADGGTEAVDYCVPVAGTGRDALYVEAIIDGVAYPILFVCGSNLITDNRNTPLPVGTAMDIRITGGTGSDDEIYDIDNIGAYGDPKSAATTITANRSTTICSGEQIELTATGPAPYNWNTGSTTQSIVVSPSGSSNYSVTVGSGCTESMANQVVTVLPKPIADAGSNQTICRGQSITLRASGGASYTWDDGQTGPSITVTPTENTTYTVTAFNGGNCRDSDQVTIFVTNTPTVTVNDNQTVCQGEAVTFTATGAFEYSWSNGMTGSSISFIPESSDNIIVTGITNGCSDMDGAVITVKPKPDVNAGNDIQLCEDGTATLEASGADSYLWSTRETGTTIMISPNSDETITVTGTQNGCAATDTIMISVQPKITADAGEDQNICDGQTAQLNATGGVTYEWSEGAGITAEVLVTPVNTTTYIVTVTEGICTDTDTLEVTVTTAFELQSSPDTTICNGTTISLMANASRDVDFTWSTNEQTSQISIQPTQSSLYSVTATDGTCEVVKDITVEIDNIDLSLSTDSEKICRGNTVTISTITNGMVIWPDGLNDAVRAFSPNKDTTYIVEALSSLGCNAESELILTVNQLPIIALDGKTYFCNGDTTEITASPGLLSYKWSDGSSDQIIQINTSGIYTVQGVDDNGCTGKASIMIDQNESPEPMILGSRTYCPGSFTELSIDQAYPSQRWSFNGGSSTEPTYSIGQEGSVTLQVTDTLGCAGTADAKIEANADLSPSISGDQLLCENTIGQLNVVGDFDDYLWSTGGTTSMIEIAEGNTYNVTVSTDDGCSGSTSIDIPVVLNPIVKINGSDGFCSGESTLLTISEFSETSWSNGSTNDSIVISEAGTIMIEVTDFNGCKGTDQIDITEWALPNVNIIGDLEFCEGDSTLLELSSSGIESIIDVEWDNGALTNSIYAKETAERIIIVEDRNGCANTASISVTQNLNPTPKIISPSIICEESETKLYTSESYAIYDWDGGISSDSFTISSGGIYQLIVTDNNGCEGTTDVMIDGADVPFMEFKNGFTLCNAKIDSRVEPLAINLDTTFTQRNITGIWSSKSTNLDLSNLPIVDFEGISAGTYEFTYTSTDAEAPCLDISQSFSLEVLDCNCPSVLLQPIEPLCSLSDILDLSSIQSSDFEGSWQIVEGPSSSLPSIAGDVFNAMDQMPGAYVLEFRLVDGIAPLGCATSKAVNLEVAPHIDAAIEVVQPACGDNPATLMLNLSGGNLYNVDIMKDDGQMISLFEVSDGHLFDVPLSGPTSFSFAQISSDSQACGFEASSNQYLFQPSGLDAQMELNQQYGAFGVSCIDAADGSAGVNILSGTAPYTYSWNNEATTPTITGLVEGTYSVTVEDAIGCTFNAAVDINAPPVKQLEIEAEDPICGQGPGRLLLKTIEGIEDGQWEFYLDGVLRSETQLPVSFNDIPPGSHTLEAYNEQGCMESHSFYIQDDSAYAIDIEGVNITLGASAVLQANFGYAYESITWSPDIYLTTTNAQTVVVEQPLNSIVYTITVIDTEGCIIEKTVTVNVDKERLLSVPTGFTPNGDSNNDAFIIHAKSDVAVINNISVFNRWGEEVFTAENVVPNQPINWDWTYRNEPLLEGQYVWKATATFIDDADLKFSGQFYIIR